MSIKHTPIDELIAGQHPPGENVRTLSRRRATIRDQKTKLAERLEYQPPDGISRSHEEEFRLNEAFAILFAESPTSDRVLEYLRSVSVNMPLGPLGVTGERALHQQGQAYHQSIIERRIALGEAKLPKREET